MKVRKSYGTIKDLVFGLIHQGEGKVDFETVTRAVRERFPDSKWKVSHWRWYKSQISKGRFKDEFSAAEKRTLQRAAKGGEGRRGVDQFLKKAVLREVVRRAPGFPPSRE